MKQQIYGISAKVPSEVFGVAASMMNTQQGGKIILVNQIRQEIMNETRVDTTKDFGVSFTPFVYQQYTRIRHTIW